MGNQLAQPQRLQPEHLAELPNLVLKDTIGGGRFLKTLLCVPDEGGLVVVKVYHKRGEVPDLRPYEQRLYEIRRALANIPLSHVWPFQHFYQTDKACYLIRQHIFSNLYHRLSTRPFLSHTEKLWIAFQLLHGLAQIQAHGICHGDIKCENVLVTSWNWAYLTDFASYKPTRLPADNPADFSFFFDTGGRRRCYIAPERFYNSSVVDAAKLPALPLQPSMDVFSLGCVFAELFLEGKALFDLSKLLAYQRGDYDPAAMLAPVDPEVRSLILNMIQRNPEDRLLAADYLQQWGPKLFPPSFEAFLHPFYQSLLPLDADARIAAVSDAFQRIQAGQGDASLAAVANGHAPAAEQLNSDSALTAHSSTQAHGHAFAVEEQGLSSVTRPQHPAQPRAQSAVVDGARQPVHGSGGQAPDQAADQQAGGAAPRDVPAAEQQVAAVRRRMHQAMGTDLLADVGALLSDTQGLLDRLDSESGSGGADDGAFYVSGGGGSPAHSCPAAAEPAEPAEPDEDRRSSSAGQREQGSSAQHAVVDAARQQPVHTAQQAQHGQVVPLDRTDATATASTSGRLGVGSAAGSGGDQESRMLLATLLCTLLRGAKLPESKVRAMAMLADAAGACGDDTRLQRLVPYLLAMVSEPVAGVRAAALRCLARVLASVEVVPPSDSKIFNEYILPSLSLVPNDQEEMVRIEYAGVTAQLATVAQRFLTRLHQVASTAQNPASAVPVRYDEEMAALRMAVEQVVHELVVGTRSTSWTRLALLPHVPALAAFLGRRESNDFLLPAMITFLNDRSWQLRAAFFTHIAALGPYAGADGLDAFLLPCLEQALADAEEAVICQAVGFLTSACQTKQLRKRSLLAAVAKVAPLLLEHPAPHVRASAVAFVAAAAASLSPAEVFAQLLPLLSHALHADPQSLTEPAALVACLHPKHLLKAGDPAGAFQRRRSHPGGSSSGRSGMPRPPRPSKDAARALGQTLPPPTLGLTGRGHGSRASLGSRPPNGTSRAQLRRNSSAAAAEDADQQDTLLQPAAPLYSIHVDSQVLHSGASYLTAIMDSLDGAAADQAAQPPGSTRSSGSADAGAAADSGQFSASAVTVPSPGKLRQRATGRLLAHASRVAGKADMGGSRLASAMHASSPFGSDDDTLSLSPRMLSERSGQTLTSPLGGAQTGSSGVGTAAVSDALAAAMATDLPAHAGSSAFRSAAAAPWHPRGVLIAHLAEHRRAVNQLAVAANGSFFASASSDETVKVWDCRRLEKDVSFRSRLTYTGQGGRILACTACQDAQSVASGSSNGSVHVWRVETVRAGNGAADRYTGIVGQRQMAVSEGAVLEVMQWASLLLYVTQRGGVHAWDLRMDRDAWTLPCTPSQGFLEKLVTESEGANWLVTGSSRGQLSLWDMRFRICVNSWQHPQRCAIDALAPALAGPARLGVPSAPANCPLVYVAAGPHEVGLWDVEEGKCHQVLRVLQHDNAELVRPELPAALRKAPNPPAASALDPAALTRHLAIQELQVPQGRATGCRTLLPTGAGPLLSAGSDCCIRLWDAALPEHSYMVCGPPMSVSRDPSAPPDKPPPDATSSLAYIYSQRSVQNVSLVEESSIVRNTDVGHHESLLHSPLDRAAALCHQDGITHMTSLEMSDRILLSCSQDGVVKAWK